jgi:hypothetical protein
VIRGYRVSWAYDSQPKIEDFFTARAAAKRAIGLVVLGYRTRLMTSSIFGEWKDVRPSKWESLAGTERLDAQP